ncbi:MAG: PLP-dependent aminotransferase family protein [Proteobacteria bacterium]|nr:PLP-dependent aminotransferase family protein [Pseudomonadota bacterium]
MTKSEQPKEIDAADLPIVVSGDAGTPRYLQLANQLQALIDSRALSAGIKLPPSRELALALGLNRNTVVAAFERLLSLGLIETRGRRGSIVCNLARQSAPRAARSKPRGRSSEARRPADGIDFRMGSADPSPLPIRVWRRACREAGRHLPGSDYGDPRGDAGLRAQIAMYLGRTRSMRVDPDQVMITAGSGRAIERIAEACLRQGDNAAAEEPGYPRAASIFERLGARLMAVPVDDEGIDTDYLKAATRKIRLIHVTTSHQYPLGGRLSSARRNSLIQWARQNGTLIIENDYDGEFRYGTAPLPALGSLAGFDHIAYVGTFSKVLSPAIRLGFVVTRSDLVEAMAALVAQARDSVSIITQRIIAWLISSGELEKHVRRVRRSYAQRRGTMLQALSEIPQVQSVTGQAAGLHVVVRLRAEVPLKALAARLEHAGIVVDRVADFQHGQRSDERMLMAYGHLSEPEIVEGVRRFGAAIRQVAPRS